MWINLSIPLTEIEKSKNWAVSLRKDLENMMSTSQVSNAMDLARECVSRQYKNC